MDSVSTNLCSFRTANGTNYKRIFKRTFLSPRSCYGLLNKLPSVNDSETERTSEQTNEQRMRSKHFSSRFMLQNTFLTLRICGDSVHIVFGVNVDCLLNFALKVPPIFWLNCCSPTSFQKRSHETSHVQWNEVALWNFISVLIVSFQKNIRHHFFLFPFFLFIFISLLICDVHSVSMKAKHVDKS